MSPKMPLTPDEYEAMRAKEEAERNGGGHRPIDAAARFNSPIRPLPHSLEAEEHLIGACLVEDDNGFVLTRARAAGITPACFFDPKLGLMFDALLRMQTDGKPLGVVTLAEELKATRQLDSIGGYAFLAEVTSRTPTTAEAVHLISRVAELATVREIIRSAHLTIEQCYSSTSDISGLCDDVQLRTRLATGGLTRWTDWPEPVGAADLCANPPAKPPVLIEGIMYAGPSTMLLSGPSKSHKTFSALDVGIAISTGEPWLGHKTTKSVVLYLNLELQDFATEDRIAKIASARGHKPTNDLRVWNLRGKAVTLDALCVQLPLKIRQYGATVVCIDPHYKVSSISGMEENSNDDQGKLLSKMEEICAKENAALILTHHFAKGDAGAKNAIDRASGGGVFARWGDVMLTFTPHAEDDAMTIEMSLRNFPPVEPFVVRWEYPRWTRDSGLDPKDLKRANGGKFAEKYPPNFLLEVLGDKLMNNSEWEKAAGFPHSTFVRKRDELLNLGKVTLEMGCYRKL